MMEFLNQFFDRYERKARLFPMVIVLAPACLAVLSFAAPKVDLFTKSLPILLCYGALCTLLSRFAREAGKGKEEALARSWGGWPSVTIFRHSDKRVDPISKLNLHLAMAQLVSNTTPVSSQQEASDLSGADQIYTAWSEFLRKKARNEHKQYPHVFSENVAYGFHRNLWGLKFQAMSILVGCLATTVAHAGIAWKESQYILELDILNGVAFAVALVVWSVCITPAWVKSAADSYAQSLIDDCVPPYKKPRATRKPT